MEGNEEEDLLLSSFSLCHCHSLNFYLLYLSEYILVHALCTTDITLYQYLNYNMGVVLT
jgi:hypothetical protein